MAGLFSAMWSALSWSYLTIFISINESILLHLFPQLLPSFFKFFYILILPFFKVINIKRSGPKLLQSYAMANLGLAIPEWHVHHFEQEQIIIHPFKDHAWYKSFQPSQFTVILIRSFTTSLLVVSLPSSSNFFRAAFAFFQQTSKWYISIKANAAAYSYSVKQEASSFEEFSSSTYLTLSAAPRLLAHCALRPGHYSMPDNTKTLSYLSAISKCKISFLTLQISFERSPFIFSCPTGAAWIPSILSNYCIWWVDKANGL